MDNDGEVVKTFVEFLVALNSTGFITLINFDSMGKRTSQFLHRTASGCFMNKQT